MESNGGVSFSFSKKSRGWDLKGPRFQIGRESKGKRQLSWDSGSFLNYCHPELYCVFTAVTGTPNTPACNEPSCDGCNQRLTFIKIIVTHKSPEKMKA